MGSALNSQVEPDEAQAKANELHADKAAESSQAEAESDIAEHELKREYDEKLLREFSEFILPKSPDKARDALVQSFLEDR